MTTNKIQNYNSLELKNFFLQIDRLPETMYTCTSAPLPGITTTPARLATPFTSTKIHGDSPQFQPFVATFIVDEDFNNWRELYDWIISYSTPRSFGQYEDNSESQNQLHSSKYSDATLIITDNKNNVNKQFKFYNIHPIDLSDILFDVQVDDVQVATCTITFEYDTYEPID